MPILVATVMFGGDGHLALVDNQGEQRMKDPYILAVIATVAFWCAWALVVLAFWVGVVCVAWHFLSKVW